VPPIAPSRSQRAKQARLHPDLEGMGTTTAALSLGDDLFVTQVGDSRAYLFHGGTLQRLT
jgi:serine/threonine protein phosphatase PrpC